MVMRLLLVTALASVGCIKSAAFQCASASQCVRDGVQGKCEMVGFCAFPDPSCASGDRYADYAGMYSNQCVGGGGGGDGGVDGKQVDAHVIDGQVPDGLGCPAGYMPLTGSSHLYKKNATVAQWASHRSGCTADGANVYLTIPSDTTELAALLTLAGADFWIGVDDITVEGSYQTVLGAPATFLPWAPGEPDNSGNQDCVQVLGANGMFDTFNCTQQRIAICECEP